MDFNYRFCNTPLFITTSMMRLKVGLPLKVYELVLPYSKHNTGYVLEHNLNVRQVNGNQLIKFNIPTN